LKICHKYADSSLLKIPFSLIAAEQELTVDFTIEMQFTTHLIRFNPPKIEFGSVFYSEFFKKVTPDFALPPKKSSSRVFESQCCFCFSDINKKELKLHEETCDKRPKGQSSLCRMEIENCSDLP